MVERSASAESAMQDLDSVAQAPGIIGISSPYKYLKMNNSWQALHKKSWAVIDRPYSLRCATVGALYERPRCIFCAKPFTMTLEVGNYSAGFFDTGGQGGNVPWMHHGVHRHVNTALCKQGILDRALDEAESSALRDLSLSRFSES